MVQNAAEVKEDTRCVGEQQGCSQTKLKIVAYR